MSITKKILKKQRRVYFSYLWRGLALIVIGIYGGIMILKDGMGISATSGRGVAIWLDKLMVWLTERGANAEQLVTSGLAGVFFILAAIGLFNVLRGMWRMSAPRTALGESVLQQAKGHESFSDVMDSINADIEKEPNRFGDVSIGRKWILEAEAMRLADIRGVFWMDEGMEVHILCCVDEAKNIWASSFRYADERDKAMEYLNSTLPDLTTGDKDAYRAYLKGVIAKDAENDLSPSKPMNLSDSATFSFVGVDGIPTSNFTYEDVCQALHSLEGSKTIALRVITPSDSVVSEIFFGRIDNQWNVGVVYRQGGEDCRTVNSMDEKEAESALESIIKLKRLPDFVVDKV